MIVELTFEEILPIWRDFLWPNRLSKIEPVSIIQIDQTIDGSISQYSPTFFGFLIDGKIAGVNSGFKTAKSCFRSRGLYVNPEFRGHNLSASLLQAVETQAKKEDCNLIWTMPRQSAFPAYSRAGYIRTSEFFSEGVEFGPNCMAIKFVV